MIIEKENIKQINILTNRLNCILKCLSDKKLNDDDMVILKTLALEVAYNINVETNNIFN